MADMGFYAEEHLDRADGFGSMAGGRSNPHRGFDVNRHGVGTPVPSLIDGVVVRSERQSGLGNVVVVRRANGTYIGHAHLNERLVGVGASVSQGQAVGTLGNTGTLTTGPHTHVTASKVSDNPSSGGVIDPLPYILWARDGGADPDGSAPAPQPPAPAPSGELRRVQGDGVEYWEPVGALAQRIGAALEARGRVEQPFDNDGDPGANWRKGVQRTLINAGFWSGEPDGKLGIDNLNGVQEYAKKFGDYDYKIDGDPQVNSWAGFALGLERP